MKSILLTTLLLAINHYLLSQDYNPNKIIPWKENNKEKYSGVYTWSDNEIDREDLRIIIEDDLIIVQSKSKIYLDNPNENWANQTIVNVYTIYSDASINGNQLTFDKETWDFVETEYDGKKLLGLLKGKDFKTKLNIGLINYFKGNYSIASISTLHEGELAFLSLKDLKIMRNEIFARYGNEFISGGEIDTYFRSQKWYRPQPGGWDENLTKIEKVNISKIKEIESLRSKGEIPTVKAILMGTMAQFNEESQKELDKVWEAAEVVWNKLNSNELQWNELTKEQENLIGSTFHTPAPIRRYVYEVEEPNPFWDPSYNVTASSTLQGSKPDAYHINNAHDLDIRTAWVEGNSGQGIGEYISYNFDYPSGILTGILVYNGYAKSDNIWSANSRVKTIKVLMEGKDQFNIELEDTYIPQLVPLNLNFSNFFKGPFTISFEITDIYPGSKYKDTALSELLLIGTQ